LEHYNWNVEAKLKSAKQEIEFHYRYWMSYFES